MPPEHRDGSQRPPLTSCHTGRAEIPLNPTAIPHGAGAAPPDPFTAWESCLKVPGLYSEVFPSLPTSSPWVPPAHNQPAGTNPSPLEEPSSHQAQSETEFRLLLQPGAQPAPAAGVTSQEEGAPSFGELRLIIITHFCCKSGRWAVSSSQKMLQEESAATSALQSWANTSQAGKQQEGKALLQVRLGIPNKHSRVGPGHSHSTRAKAGAARPQDIPGSLQCCQDRKIRAGDSSGLTLSHGTSQGPSLGSFTKALFFFFASPLLHFPATDNATNLWNCNEYQTVSSMERFLLCSISMDSVPFSISLFLHSAVTSPKRASNISSPAAPSEQSGKL